MNWATLPLHYKYNPKLKAKILNAKNEFNKPENNIKIETIKE